MTDIPLKIVYSPALFLVFFASIVFIIIMDLFDLNKEDGERKYINNLLFRMTSFPIILMFHKTSLSTKPNINFNVLILVFLIASISMGIKDIYHLHKLNKRTAILYGTFYFYFVLIFGLVLYDLVDWIRFYTK